MMVLVSAPKDLNLIALNGDISTLDLLHLRGHFGIPRFSGDRFVPGPAPRGASLMFRLGPLHPCPNRRLRRPPSSIPAAYRHRLARQWKLLPRPPPRLASDGDAYQPRT